MTARMPHAARTDVGRRREHNEDALLEAPPVFAVADGVGGSAKGEVASQTALDSFAERAHAIAEAASSSEATRAMEDAVLAANSAVHEAQLRDDTLRGMATTITAAVVRDGGEVVVGHVGDSRLYVISAAGARQATDDHSVVAELVRTGRIQASEAATHPQRNVITRALGTESDVSVDAFVVHVGPGDWLLACSDGLTEHVADGELARVLIEQGREPDAALARLVDLANERGGTDNISVVVAQPVPSDVSGELSVEALHAAAATTGQIRRPVVSDAPAHDSGPLPAVIAPDTSVHLPVQPMQHEPPGEVPVRRTRTAWRGLVLVALLAIVAAIVGGFMWSQSYFLLEREDGRVGINRGFPFARLAQPHKTSDVVAEELDESDREQLVESHRILSREDAERVLDGLPDRIDGSLDQEQEAPDAGESARP